MRDLNFDGTDTDTDTDAPIVQFRKRVYTIAYRVQYSTSIQYTFTRVHARIPNGQPREDPRAEVGEDVRVGVGPMEFKRYRQFTPPDADATQLERRVCRVASAGVQWLYIRCVHTWR